MALRWLSAGVGIPLLLALTYLGGTAYSAAILLLAIIGLREITTAVRAVGIRANPFLAASGLLPPAWALLAGPSALSPATFHLYEHLPSILAGLVILAFCWEVLRAARTPEINIARNVAFGALCGIYIALFGGLGYLREGYPYSLPGTNPALEFGARLVLLTFCCVWATDSFAFFTGKAVGRRKLAPVISPNKTVEGGIGGLIAAVVIGGLFGQVLLNRFLFGIAIGLIAGVFGQLGDLFESSLKRELGVKDLGGIIPGHGGILDRFDSLLFVAPVVALVLPLLI